MCPPRHPFVFIVQFTDKILSDVRLCTAVVVLYVKHRGGGGQHRVKEHRRDPSQAVLVPSTKHFFHPLTHIERSLVPYFHLLAGWVLCLIVWYFRSRVPIRCTYLRSTESRLS